MQTRTLLRLGAASAVLFVVVLFLEGALRVGYDPLYHTGSALSLGERGWIQTANFLQIGLGAIGFGLGIGRALGDRISAGLVVVFGLAMAASGIFVMDPMRGYPPGTPAGTPEELSWHHQLHDAFGPLAFFALLVGCVRVSPIPSRSIHL